MSVVGCKMRKEWKNNGLVCQERRLKIARLVSRLFAAAWSGSKECGSQGRAEYASCAM